MNEPPIPQNIIAELFSLLNRTITVIEQQNAIITGRPSDCAVAIQTEKIKANSTALASAVASQTQK